MKRRSVLQAVAAVAGAPPLGAVASGVEGGSVYARLGVKPLINGMGTVTVVGGSLMPPEVVRAMEEASRHFVFVPDLQAKAGARIAELLGVPAAMVTAGAASAIAVATAASMTRGDPKKIAQLPDTTGLPFEVIQQKSHRCGYEPQILLNGAKIVTVETREEIDRAIGERTAMMFFLNKAEPDGRIKRDEWVGSPGSAASSRSTTRLRTCRRRSTCRSTSGRASTSWPSPGARACEARSARVCCSGART